ncbi:hypothetical protein ACQKKK_05595 [Peribacillus sp. NPDC006672]|uniref:hypothetical protein n=1 Tax=Peribacillus sp. NPDC006672 TaxID=3390606 RepID=UPI003D04E3A2
MKKKFICLFLVVLALFTGCFYWHLVESGNFEGAQQASAVVPKVLPAIAAIGTAAIVAQAGVRVATGVGKAVGA